jgi:hypothetical protein
LNGKNCVEKNIFSILFRLIVGVGVVVVVQIDSRKYVLSIEIYTAEHHIQNYKRAQPSHTQQLQQHGKEERDWLATDFLCTEGLFFE